MPMMAGERDSHAVDAHYGVGDRGTLPMERPVERPVMSPAEAAAQAQVEGGGPTASPDVSVAVPYEGY
jgi:hypothetical protein